MDGPRFDVFLSHNSKDKPTIERIASKLKQAGLEPWLDIWALTPGGRWQEEIAEAVRVDTRACAIFLGPHGIGDWSREELDLAKDRSAKDRTYRLFLVLLPGLPDPFDPSTLPPFLSMHTWVDFRKGFEEAHRFQPLINAIKGIPLGPSKPIEPNEDVCPYRGLQAFDEEHAEYFFGREADVQRLLEHVKSDRFLAVVGASGSGKSSLVRAGLIPALKNGRLPESNAWTYAVMTPGAHPLEALVDCLSAMAPEKPRGAMLDELARDPRSLHLHSRDGLRPDPRDARVVLVVDQFEEVFTLCRDEQERVAFISNVLYAAGVPDGHCVAILTLRADFYPRCAAYPDLARVISTHQYLVSPLDDDGLWQAIVEPAWQVGLDFEEGLIPTILQDIAREPGNLPLLEHALLELWTRRRGRLMTLEGYRESGGVTGAIAKRADEVYGTFTPEQQAIARRIMLRLTQPGEGTEDTRRRAPFDELVVTPGARPAVEAVVGAMVEARLLTTSAEADGQTWVDVAHEALIRGWPRLRGWIDEDRAGLRAHRRLTEAAQEWQRLGQDEGALYRGSRLTEALELRDRDPGTINDLERRFLDAAVAHREAEVLQRERTRQARERNQRRVAIGLAAGLLIAAILAVLAWTQRGEAQAGRRDALRAQQAALAGQSTAVQSQLEAVSAQETAESRRLEAEAAQAEANNQRSTAVAAEAAAEARRQEAEAAQLTAEARRGESDEARATAEARRQEAEAAREDANVQKAAADDARATAEDRRLAAESAQLTAEARREEAAAAQQTALADRNAAELAATEAAQQRSTAVAQATVAAVANETAQADRQVAEDRATEAAEQRGTAVAQATVAGAANQTAQAERSTAEARATEAAQQRSTAVAQATVADSARLTAEANRNEANAQATIASEQRAEAERQAEEANRARLSQLAAVAVNEPAGDRALLLGAEAYRLNPETFESRSGLLSTLARTPQLSAFLQSQNGDALDVAVSPDNSIVASADGYLVVLWDGRSYLRLDTLDDEQANYVRSLSFSPDGTMLAAGNESGVITVWDVASRTKVTSIGDVESDRVTSVAFNAAGTLIAAGNNDGTITVWDVAAGATLDVLDGSAEGIVAVAFSPDDRFLVAGLGDGRAAIWNAEDRQLLRFLPVGGAGSDIAIAFNTSGNGLATATFPGIVTIWTVTENVAEWTPIGQPLSTSLGTILDLAFSPNGKWLAAGGIDGRIVAWDAATFAATELNPGYGAFVWGITFAGDGDRLFSTLGLTTHTDEGGRRGAVVVWDLAATSRLAQPVTGQQTIGNVVFSADGQLLIPGFAGLLALNPATQSLVPGGMMRITDFSGVVAVSSDGQLIAVIRDDGGIDLWNAGSWTQSGPSLPSQNATPRELAFSRDGTLLAAISDHAVLLWDLQTRTALAPLTTTSATHSGLAFGPGNLLAVGSNQRVGLWDTSSRTRIAYIAEKANAVAISPNGSHVAVATFDTGEVVLWDVVNDTIVERLSSPSGTSFDAVAFDPSGTLLAGGGLNGDLIMWEVASRRQLGLLAGGFVVRSNIWSIAFSPDGSLLVTSAGDGGITLYPVTPGAWAGRACTIAGRNLTQSEWSVYLPDIPYDTICPSLAETTIGPAVASPVAGDVPAAEP